MPASTQPTGRQSYRIEAVAITPEREKYPFVEGSSTHSEYRLSFTEKRTWTKRDEREFLDLARKEALETLTRPELKKLETLEQTRNALTANRSFLQILSAKRQFEKAEQLITALHGYLDTTH
jgi:hypothetical protein